jgi:hypothetical protein
MDYAASSGRIICESESGEDVDGSSSGLFTYLLGGLRQITKNLSGQQAQGQDLDLGPPKYKAVQL